MKSRALLCAVLLAALHCGGSENGGDTHPLGETERGGNPENPAASVAPPASSKTEMPKFFEIENFTVVRKLEGIQSGTVTEHIRDWGRQRAEIRDLTIGIAGFTQTQRTRAIHEGEWIVAIDLDRGTATRTRNPMFNAFTEVDDPREVAERLLDSFAGPETGETGSYAGEDCRIRKHPQLGQTSCISEHGFTLYTTNENLGVSETAVEVRRGDGGPDAAFEVPSGMEVAEGPDLEAIMKEGGGVPDLEGLMQGKDGAPDLEELMKGLAPQR